MISVLPEVIFPKAMVISVIKMYTCIVTVHIYLVLLGIV